MECQGPNCIAQRAARGESMCSSDSSGEVPPLSEEYVKLLRGFHEEVTTLSKLRHPNIVLFMAACPRPPHLYIITEFCHGGNLYCALRRRSWRERLGPRDFIPIARHIARGMQYLHSCKIIHRDLKSQNLLLDRPVEEGIPVIKIADFGLSRRYSTYVDHSSMSGSTAGIMTSETGTYRWMAPEVIRHERYNEKVDVYSFGVVLWELFSSEVPFAGMTPIQAAFAVADKDLRPSACADYAKTMPIPAGWMALISRCWHPSSHYRPRFKEIVGALDEMEKVGFDQNLRFWRDWDERRVRKRCAQRRADSEIVKPELQMSDITSVDSKLSTADSHDILNAPKSSQSEPSVSPPNMVEEQSRHALVKLCEMQKDGDFRGDSGGDRQMQHVHRNLAQSGSAPDLRVVL